MEFFRTVDVKTEEHLIQTKLTFENLADITSELYVLNPIDETQTNIDGLWGEFTLTRHVIKGGLRFALVECPNALTWTVTTGHKPNPDCITIHLTINRVTHSEDFISEIQVFLDNQVTCLNKFNH